MWLDYAYGLNISVSADIVELRFMLFAEKKELGPYSDSKNVHVAEQCIAIAGILFCNDV